MMKAQLTPSFIDDIYKSTRYVPVALGIIPLSLGTFLIHELGHLLTSFILYPERQGTIFFDLKRMAFVTFSSLEKHKIEVLTFKEEVSDGLVALAGPLATIQTIALTSVAAWRLRHSNPRLALALSLNATIVGIDELRGLIFSYAHDDYSRIEQGLKIPKAIQAIVAGGVALGVTSIFAKLCKSVYNDKKEEFFQKFKNLKLFQA